MTDSTGDATQRLVDALNDPDWLFNRGQLVYIMAAAMGWGEIDPLSYEHGRQAGYQQRVDEENAAWPAPPFLIVQGIKVRGDQAAARAAGDADRTQRYAGGAVEVWDADRPDLPDLGPSARSWNPQAGVPAVQTRNGWAWRDET